MNITRWIFSISVIPLCVCEIWGFFGIAENKRIVSQEIELFSSAVLWILLRGMAATENSTWV